MDQIATDIQGEDNRDIKLGLIIGLSQSVSGVK